VVALFRPCYDGVILSNAVDVRLYRPATCSLHAGPLAAKGRETRYQYHRRMVGGSLKSRVPQSARMKPVVSVIEVYPVLLVISLWRDIVPARLPPRIHKSSSPSATHLIQHSSSHITILHLLGCFIEREADEVAILFILVHVVNHPFLPSSSLATCVDTFGNLKVGKGTLPG
jgi:hypothetical protein